MDVIDQAQEHEERLRAEAIARVAVKPGQEISSWFCEDCLQSIPHKRREAVKGCTRCVECQGIYEFRGRA